MKVISQREARKLRKRVQELELERVRLLSAWSSSAPPNAVHVRTWKFDEMGEAMRLAARLGCVLLMKHYCGNEFAVYAVKPS